MPIKDFERVLGFTQGRDGRGQLIFLPLVEATLIAPASNRVLLSLLFDTGASVTTLRADLYPLLGLQSWDEGLRVDTITANATVQAYQYSCFSLEIFGQIIQCPINLMQMPSHPLFHGLLGRDTIFNQFGFGFWESTHELYITTNP